MHYFILFCGFALFCGFILFCGVCMSGFCNVCVCVCEFKMKNGVLSPGEPFKCLYRAERVACMRQLKLSVVIWNYKLSALNVDCFQ